MYRPRVFQRLVKEPVTISKHDEQGIRASLAHRECNDYREPLRDPIADVQQPNTTCHALQTAVQNGLKSGISDKASEPGMADVSLPAQPQADRSRGGSVYNTHSG